jgi:hypothetical protein
MSEHRTVNALSLTCHLEQSEGSHTGCAKRANVPRVINHPVGGPSPSARLGITA